MYGLCLSDGAFIFPIIIIVLWIIWHSFLRTLKADVVEYISAVMT